MSYTYSNTIDTTPVIIESGGTLAMAQSGRHTIQGVGGILTVDIELGNSGAFNTITTITDDIVNLNASGITRMQLTSDSSTVVRISGA